MKLEQLMEDVPFTLVQGTLETEVEDIIYDSRKAAPGLLFVCIVGTQRDSHDLAADCVAKGVNTLVIQHDIDLSTMPDVNVIKVESSRYAMAKMSANLFGNPSRQMTMIGVTGTKGKTTTTHMIKSVLEAAGRKVGMIGTNGIYFLGHHKETANTTPESYELQKTFRQFLDAGCDTALMEVSSQGLMMDRVAGIHFNVGVSPTFRRTISAPVSTRPLRNTAAGKASCSSGAISAWSTSTTPTPRPCWRATPASW